MQIPLVKRKLHVLYIALAVVSLLLGGIAHVRAEEPTLDSGTPTPTPSVREERMGMPMKERDRFVNLVRNVYGKMDAAIARLSNITTRLEARLDIQKNAGVDTSRASVPLAEAKVKLAEAKTRLDAVRTQAERALEGDNPRGAFPPARGEFREVRELIREAFILIRESLAEMRDASLVYELNRRNVGAVPVGTSQN